MTNKRRPDLRYALATLFSEENRGLLLDLVVFVANLFLMGRLTGLFLDLFSHASADEPLAKAALALTVVAMWVLPATGAVLKRWHFHQRLGKAATDEHEYSSLAGCLFHPIFYLSLNLVLMSIIVATFGGFVFGNEVLMENGNIFLPMIFGGMVLTILQTWMIYRYFSPPQKPPKSAFLQRPESELLGDVFIFGNMILFQVAWNLLTMSSLGPLSGLAELLGRIFFLSFIALLVYFPPRLLYLAEDLHRGRTWLTMLLANSPVVARVVFGL